MLNLKQLAKDRWLTQVDIAKILNVQQSKISELMNRPERIRPEIIAKLVDHFGEDVVNSYMTPPTPPLGAEQDAKVTIYDAKTVETIRQETKEEESIPVIPDIILSRRNLDIRKYINSRGSELSSIDPRELVDGAEFAMEILKDSMAPDIIQGDTVFLQFLPPTAKLHSGSAYFIDTPAYAGVIRDVYIDGNKMTLKARNRNFGDIVLDMTKDSFTAANIVGLYRKSFNSAASQIEEMRRSKDEQICRVLNVVEQQAAQQGKLIDFITTHKSKL